MTSTRKTRSRGNSRPSSCFLRKAPQSGWNSAHKKHGSNSSFHNNTSGAQTAHDWKTTRFAQDFFQCSCICPTNILVCVGDIFWRPPFPFSLYPWRAGEIFWGEGWRNISGGYMGTQHIGQKFIIYLHRNIGIIFIKHFVDKNKYIYGGSCYVLPPFWNNKHIKQKHSQINGLVLKYLKSDYRAILGQLCVR